MGEAKRRKRYQQQTGKHWPRTSNAIHRQRTMPVSEVDPYTETFSTRMPPIRTGWDESLGGCWHGDVFDPGARPLVPRDQWDQATAETVAELELDFVTAVVRDADRVKVLCADPPWRR